MKIGWSLRELRSCRIARGLPNKFAPDPAKSALVGGPPGPPSQSSPPGPRSRAGRVRAGLFPPLGCMHDGQRIVEPALAMLGALCLHDIGKIDLRRGIEHVAAGL